MGGEVQSHIDNQVRPMNPVLEKDSLNLKNSNIESVIAQDAEPKYLCKKCNAKFLTSKLLQNHMYYHARPFGCKECDKRFNSKARLDYHYSNAHNREKSFECLVCKNKFAQKKQLDRHRAVHIGEKPFECEVCFKTFAQKRNLNVHAITHSDKRPYECEECPKKYKHLPSLWKHQRDNHSDKPSQSLNSHGNKRGKK